MKKVIPLFVFLLILLTIGVLSAQEGPAFEPVEVQSVVNAPQSDLVVTMHAPETELKAAQAYWTPDKIAALEPVPMPVDYSTGRFNRAVSRREKITGAPGFALSGAAAPDADAIASAAYPEAWVALDDDLALDAMTDSPVGTSAVYTAFRIKYPPYTKYYPHKWVGRFVSDSGYCSGTAISNNTVVTAAHCVFDSDTDTWFSNMAFMPAFRKYTAPYGVFNYTSCSILGAYFDLPPGYSINSWAPFDVAVCSVGTNSDGFTLNEMVGWAGREWDAPYVRHFHNMGLPWVDYNEVWLPDAGKYLRICIAESFQRAADVRGMGCNMGGGMSGGPWMSNYAPPQISGNVSGVNSGIIYTQQNLYAGRFTSNNIVPLCTLEGC